MTPKEQYELLAKQCFDRWNVLPEGRWSFQEVWALTEHLERTALGHPGLAFDTEVIFGRWCLSLQEWVFLTTRETYVDGIPTKPIIAYIYCQDGQRRRWDPPFRYAGTPWKIETK